MVMNIGVDCPKPPSLIVLTAGREAFLEENLLSIQRQTLPPPMVVLVNDGPPLTARLEAMAVQSAPQVRILQTESPGSGQWNAFRLGLMGLKTIQPFSIIHDDDRLKPDYVETLTKFGAGRTTPWICSHNLEVFSKKQEQPYLILPKESQAFVLNNQAEVCLRYSQSFIPFPGTCFGMSPAEVVRHLKPEYQEMADVVLLCECSRQASIFYEPRPLYEYRRHDKQVSERMDYAMEDKLQDYLLHSSKNTEFESLVRKKLEKRRAERFFSLSWNAGTFQLRGFRKDFSWWYAFRAVRNRKWAAVKILAKDLFYKILPMLRFKKKTPHPGIALVDAVPRQVHAIWLDRCPLPDRLQSFRNSWGKYLHGYTVHEWTRHNLPLENPFVARQMNRGNYCFACDYLRWERVYRMGGIYFDCDVEVLKPLDPILAGGGFLGFECIQNRIRKNAIGTAIFGFPAGHWLPRRVLEHFHRHPDSTPLATDLLTQMMLREGLDKFDLEREEFEFIRIQDVRVFHGDILYPDTHGRYRRREDVPARSFTIHHVSGHFQGSELDPHPWYRRLRDYRLDRKLLRPVERAIKKMLGRR